MLGADDEHHTRDGYAPETPSRRRRLVTDCKSLRPGDVRSHPGRRPTKPYTKKIGNLSHDIAGHTPEFH